VIKALAATHARAFTATRAWSDAEFTSLLASRGVILAGDPKAFALGRVTLDEAEILTLATDPAHQRKGLARAVLMQFEAMAKAREASTIFLEVAADNIAALALYSSEGYAQVGQRPGYYDVSAGTPVTALVLRKVL
jgi:[ribosomal protein S18]-alanine N-acetyltransferase